MSERIHCRSYIAGSKTYERCLDGFPQTASCSGIGGAVPFCMQEERCGRLYNSSGGRPPLVSLIVARERAEVGKCAATRQEGAE